MSGVLYSLKLVEGKDEPKDKPAKEYSEFGKTTGLCLCLTKSIHGTGNVVVMDSGFCVLKAIVTLKNNGVFSSALIKKRRYWPKYVKGNEAKEHFADEIVCHFYAKKVELDQCPFYTYGMKEPDYVLLFMTTFGSGIHYGKEQTRSYKDADGTSRKVCFTYPEVCYLHYTH